MDTIVGIDLGTTNSEVALVRDGQPHVFAEDGDPSLPSFVGLSEDGRLLVGGTLDVGDAERVVRPEVIDSMWGDLVAKWPAANGLRVEYTWACFRPAHPDHLQAGARSPRRLPRPL